MLNEQHLTEMLELMRDWDSSLNPGINPEKITRGSHQKIKWKCHKCGRIWEAQVKNRVNGCGCTCDAAIRKVKALQRTLVGKYGSLTKTRPDLAAQWHPTLNGDLTPNDITAKSTYKAWWIDEKGIPWKAEIAARNRHDIGSGLPSNIVIQGYNDLQTQYATVASEWHPYKNGILQPKDYLPGSKEKVWWCCEKGHEWQASIVQRVKGSKCPICNKEKSTSFPEQAIFFYVKQCFPNSYNRYCVEPRLEVDVYIPAINIGIEYDGAYYHKSDRKQKIDNDKNQRLKALGIHLIRIIEDGGTVPINSEHVIYCKKQKSVLQLDEAITAIFDEISNICFTHFECDIDVNRDYTAILEQYVLSEKKNSIAAVTPELLEEWHPSKNGLLKPDFLQTGSNKRCWWKCKICGYEWRAIIHNRTRGQGCPVCAGTVVAQGINDLVTTHPDLIKEWNYKKNGDLRPEKYSYGSNKKVWWICRDCNYEWQASIVNRCRFRGCPQCTGKTTAPEKSLQTLYPIIAAEWHPSLNKGITPSEVLPKSEKKIWWICNKGHTWQAIIRSRTLGYGCPYCGNKKLLSGFNDLATVYPEIAAEWDANNASSPSQVLYGSNKRFKWRCSNGHCWETSVFNRTRGSGCPYCKGKKAIPGETDIASKYPELVAEWNFDKNQGIIPDDITPGSNRKVWWKCKKCNGEWKASVVSRKEGRGCPYCAGKKPLPGKTDLATLKPELALEWNSNKNIGLRPEDFLSQSGKVVWWQCSKCGHEWQARISARSRGFKKCPKCNK